MLHSQVGHTQCIVLSVSSPSSVLEPRRIFQPRHSRSPCAPGKPPASHPPTIVPVDHLTCSYESVHSLSNAARRAPGSETKIEQGSIVQTDASSTKRREACTHPAFAASLRYILHMKIVKTSTTYFASTRPATTAAILSRI
jgi:hypothetical protein